MLLWLFSLFLQLLGLIVLIPILLFTYKWLFPSKPKLILQKRDWEKDVVYLCQFPLCPSVRSISPFALKVETWLRLANIKYENIFTMKFHPKTHQIPYIELNGESLGDSNVIISKLTEQFGVSLDNDLTGEQAAMSRAATSMVENYTAQTGFHYRYGYNMARFVEFLQLGEYFNSQRSIRFWTKFQPFSTRLRNHLSGLSRVENATVWSLASKDLLALSAWLGEKPFFHGSSPTSVDCMMFGQLAQFLYIDIGFPQKTFIETDCRNLVDFVARMKEKYWSDWDESIENSKEIMKNKI